MFSKYQTISENYVPNNRHCNSCVGKSYTKLDPLDCSKPYEEYSAKGELIGYSWHYGETMKLDFNIDGEIVVESDAIVYNVSFAAPTESTVGRLNQKAYNIVDLKSWTCVAVEDERYTWTEDIEFRYLEESGKSIYVDASKYLRHKKVKITIYNFRREIIHEKIFRGSTRVTLSIDKTLSEEKFKKGIYYCSLIVFDNIVSIPVFSPEDCILLVK